MGLKKNDTTKILLFGIGVIFILAAGIMFRTWRYYSRKMMIRAMYIRRIGCFTTPPHGDPEAGEVAWSVAGRVRVVLRLFKPGGLLSVFMVSWRPEGFNTQFGSFLGPFLGGVRRCLLPLGGSHGFIVLIFWRLLETRTVFVLYSFLFNSAYWRRSGLMNLGFNHCK